MEKNQGGGRGVEGEGKKGGGRKNGREKWILLREVISFWRGG